MKRGRCVACAVALAGLCFARLAGAHVIGLSRGEYTPRRRRRSRAEITLRADDAALAVPGLDADGDGQVSRRRDRARAARP